MIENETSGDVKAAFKVFDQDGDGFISGAELKAVMLTLGEVQECSVLARLTTPSLEFIGGRD